MAIPKKQLPALLVNPSNSFDNYIVNTEDAGTTAIRQILDLGALAVTVDFGRGLTKQYSYA